LIKKNPKIFIGYSDITTLLLAINKKASLVTFHGTNLCNLKKLTKESLVFLFDMLTGKRGKYILPDKMEIIKKGGLKEY